MSVIFAGFSMRSWEVHTLQNQDERQGKTMTVNRLFPVSRTSRKFENTSMSYESYRETNPAEEYWHQVRREAAEPFFAVAELCESCGRPCESRVWDSRDIMWKGPCCASEAPDEPLCGSLVAALDQCKSVRAIQLAVREHLASCPVCSPKVVKMEPQKQGQGQQREREAA
jgi:hypothetical protein